MNGIKTGAARATTALGIALIGVLITAGVASATPDPVGEAFSDATTKATTYAGFLIAFVVAVALLLMGVSWVRKVRNP